MGASLKLATVALLLASCALGLGCKRRKSSEASPAGAPVPPTAESGISTPPPGSQSPITPAELAALNQAVAMYGTETMGGKRTKFPTSVEQLVSEKFLAYAPVAPPGKKFIINPRTGLIEIVNQ